MSASAVLVPLYDPVRLAEDLAFLDVAHPGRLRVTAGLGYRPAEYDWLGRPFAERGALMDAALASILHAWPALGTRSPRPEILAVGGQTVVAARRAVRHGLPFAPRAHLPELAATHAVMCAEAGVEARCWMPSSRFLQVHVADDPDEAWARVGRRYLDDVREYAGWQRSGPPSPVFSGADDTDSLRRSGAIHVVTPEQCVALATDRPDTTVCLHPLAGGMSTDDAWAGVQCFIDRVLPQLAADPATRVGAAPDPGGDHGP